MNLSELRDAVRERGGVASADQLAQATNLTNLINAALHWVERQNPRGWSWLVTEATYSSGGVYSIPFSSFSVSSIQRVHSLWCVLDGIRYKIQRTSYQDAWDRYPNEATEQALADLWAVQGRTVWLRPKIGTSTTVRIVGTRTEPDLSGSSDTPLMPSIHHDLIVERAAYLLFRRMKDTTNAQEAQVAAEALLRDLLQADREYGGAGQVQTDPAFDLFL